MKFRHSWKLRNNDSNFESWMTLNNTNPWSIMIPAPLRFDWPRLAIDVSGTSRKMRRMSINSYIEKKLPLIHHGTATSLTISENQKKGVKMAV